MITEVIKAYTIRTVAWIVLLALPAPFALAENGEASNDKGTAPPNTVFFIADDMYRDMMNFLPEGEGRNLTPNLDRLAAEGTIMTNQYVVSPVCTPSRFNCLTGQFASRSTSERFLRTMKKAEGHPVIQWNTYVTNSDKILPEYLQEIGYATGFAGKNHVIEDYGKHWFEDFNANARDPEIAALLESNYDNARNAVLDSGFDYAGGVYENNPNFIGVAELAVQNMDWIAAAGLEFIDQNAERPFFLYFATTIPHGPREPERSWQADPRITAKGYLEEALDVLPARETLPKRIEEAGLGGQNKELVLWLDDAIGALLDKLEEKGVLDNTIIFFFNDHGQVGKGTLYQGGVLNPSLVWRKGGFPVGNTCDQPVLNVDFMPTILELAGGSVDDVDCDGKSFLPLLQGEEVKHHDSLYFELGYAKAVVMGKFKYYALRYPDYIANRTPEERAAVLEAFNETRRFRNMEVINTDPSAPNDHIRAVPGNGGEFARSKPSFGDYDQLYNLEEDPDESVNLADDPEYSKVLVEMKAELQKYLDTLPGKFPL